jgi:hypothetical protein
VRRIARSGQATTQSPQARHWSALTAYAVFLPWAMLFNLAKSGKRWKSPG